MKKLCSAVILILMIISLSAALVSCDSNVIITYDDSEKYCTIGEAPLPQFSAEIRIEIEWINGNVEISRHSGAEIKMEEAANRETQEHEKLRYYFDGYTLHIKYAKSGTWKFGNLSKDLSLTLPAGLEISKAEIDTVSANVKLTNVSPKDAEIETTSGNVSLDGGKFTDIYVSTASGELDIKNSEITASLEADTVSGDVDIFLSGSTANAEIDTVSGSVSLYSDKISDLEIATTGGDITLTLGALGNDTKLSTVSGTTDMTLDKNSAFSLEFDTVSGDFNSEIPTSKKGDRYIAGTDAYGTEIEFESVSGNLDIHAIN